MIMRIRNRNADKQKRGFTLTEIAIVLGIVGLILGAIWVAAAAVYNNLRVSRATTDMLTIAQNVRAMYATSPTVDVGADMKLGGAQANGQLTYVTGNVFPSDMIVGGNTIVSPWGGSVAVTSAQNVNAGDSFVVTFDAVPQSACISMVTTNSGNGRDSGLFNIGITAAGALPYAGGAAITNEGPLAPGGAGITASAAQAGCTKATNAIAFAFRLKG